MPESATHPIHRLANGGLEPDERPLVREYPLRLTVNGRELATLIASPHQLNYLVAGFLRNQGFAERLDDFLQLGICAEFGAAQARLKREIPDTPSPPAARRASLSTPPPSSP